MADRDRQPQQLQVHHQRDPRAGRPSVGKILAVVTLFPLGSTLLALSGMTLIATLIGLAVAAPAFVVFSPIIVPAAAVIGLAIAAFVSAGAFGLTGLSSLSLLAQFLRQASMALPGGLDLAQQRMQDVVGRVGRKAGDLGQAAQSKAQEEGRAAS